ncbi:MAG: hypothetical protein EP149_10840 [Phascolarctobacterium sp.]|nr:hypothetical protein [Phascolarctobacterium sp.]MUU08117.1 hypothetical protein [Phascolarctobacterium sp.]MUU17760.1 hypothetical protein [Phascolarctobacterium sp.]
MDLAKVRAAVDAKLSGVQDADKISAAIVAGIDAAVKDASDVDQAKEKLSYSIMSDIRSL